MTRLPTGGLIDRSTRLRFTFNGRAYVGHEGDTLASALLANGVRLIGRSFKYHRPRGIMAAGAEEANALVELGRGNRAEPNLKATQVPLNDGLEATSVNCWPSPRFDLRGINQLASPLFIAGFYYKTFMWPDWHLFEGPIRRAAGLGVAPEGRDPDRYVHAHARHDVIIVGGGPAGLEAAREAAMTGASVLILESDFVLGGSALWRGGIDVSAMIAVLQSLPNVSILTRTEAFGYYDHNSLAAVENLEDAAGPRQRLWKLRAGRVIIATGAIERPLVFAGNDRPGVMLASAAQAYVRRFGVLPGRRVVIATNNDSTRELAGFLTDAGASVEVMDSRNGVSVIKADGALGVRSVRLSDGRKLPCDLVLMSGGWSPVVHLFSQSGGKLRYDETIAAFVPHIATQRVECIGGAAGDFGALGIEPDWDTPGKGKKFVDFANDVTARDIAIAASENYRSVEHLKRYTTLGMGPDQGKTSNVNGLALMGQHTGRAPGEVGTTKFRPPYNPVTFGTLAGPLVGALHTPIKCLPAHTWHAQQGAAFEEHGRWIRPTAYPRAGESWEDAALREAREGRTSAVLFDGSPLGKIEVCGPDAATFLDRIYVGNASTLKPGRARYGLMLSEHGVIADDGIFVRLAEDRFLVHTTSGGADRIALALEEWLQCEWTDLAVVTLPATSQWAVMTISGPRARETIATVGTDIDLADFPHMAYREGIVAGFAARVLRASFTGEASYEISVAARHAVALAEYLGAAGVIPIGVEALNILRTEKGYLHIGVDTDGTTLPGDVGMAGPIAKKAADFVGRRSLMRDEALRTDRLQLVGLLSDGPLLAVGSQVLAPGGHVPGRSDGHVTSSVFSPSLGRPIALGLVRAGRSRLGESVELYDMGRRLRATIVEPVFVDKAGEKLNG
jgi:sarcosine oxidase subunit alpha